MYKSKQNKSRRKNNNKRGPIKTGSLRINNQYIERSRFPTLPKEIEFALTAYYHDERTGGQTTQAERITPLCEFNTILPRYGAELYQIYRHARIMAIDIHMEVVNTSSTEPLICAIGCLPLANCNAITNPQTIVSVPGAAYKQVGLSTGMSRATISKRFVTERMLGELTIGSNTYLQTYSEALSSAVWTELPAIYAGVIAARNGATWTGIIDYKYTYHIRWSEYSIPSLGFPPLRRSPKLMDQDKSESEEVIAEDWVQPPPLPKLKKRLNASSLSYAR